jgi:hypothetical protein
LAWFTRENVAPGSAISLVIFTMQAEKKAAIESYKSHLQTVPCRHFDEGRGTCPFGTSCFYKHAYPDGTLEQPRELKVRMATNSHGEYAPLRDTTLSSTIDFVRLRRAPRRTPT